MIIITNILDSKLSNTITDIIIRNMKNTTNTRYPVWKFNKIPSLVFNTALKYKNNYNSIDRYNTKFSQVWRFRAILRPVCVLICSCKLSDASCKWSDLTAWCNLCVCNISIHANMAFFCTKDATVIIIFFVSDSMFREHSCFFLVKKMETCWFFGESKTVIFSTYRSFVCNDSRWRLIKIIFSFFHLEKY